MRFPALNLARVLPWVLPRGFREAHPDGDGEGGTSSPRLPCGLTQRRLALNGRSITTDTWAAATSGTQSQGAGQGSCTGATSRRDDQGWGRHHTTVPYEEDHMEVMTERSADDTTIRPFTIETPEAELEDLRARLAATRFPEKEPVDDPSQGVQLATMQALARYWLTEYDWRKCEDKLKALPHFITEIDGLDIHFVHVRSQHEDAMPLLVAHGWPGSVIEQLKIIDPLTNPTAHGASAVDAFHLVIPSMPGYGFSGKPTETGWGPEHIARAYAELMERLGYDRYVAQGGDWGGQIVDLMGAQAPPGLVGIHTNFPGAVRDDVTAAVVSGGPPPSGLDDEETRLYEKLRDFWAKDVAKSPSA